MEVSQSTMYSHETLTYLRHGPNRTLPCNFRDLSQLVTCQFGISACRARSVVTEARSCNRSMGCGRRRAIERNHLIGGVERLELGSSHLVCYRSNGKMPMAFAKGVGPHYSTGSIEWWRCSAASSRRTRPSRPQHKR